MNVGMNGAVLVLMTTPGPEALTYILQLHITCPQVLVGRQVPIRLSLIEFQKPGPLIAFETTPQLHQIRCCTPYVPPVVRFSLTTGMFQL